MDDGDDDSKEFDDGYDENLMGDEEDKRKLAQMTEKEREQELYNRGERRETLKIRFEIERKLRSKAKNKREQEKKPSKQVRARKRLRASEIYSSDDESSEDSDEYIPDAADKTSTLNDASTGGKSSKMNTRASSTLLSSSSSPSSVSSASSSSSSSDSEPEHDNYGADDDSQMADNNFQMTLADLRALQLKRDRIEEWVYAPFFKETAIGLFCKMSVGESPTGEHRYKVAYIVDITEGLKDYEVGLRKTKTDKQVLVRICGVERTYKMSFISNRIFDDGDYIKWRDNFDTDGHGMPSREHFIRKKRDLHRAMNYEYKDEDIAYVINERSRFKELPCNFAKKKSELMGEKADAEAQNDFEKARELQMRIDELEERAKQLEKSRSSSTFSAISFVNERNRIKNIEESERVLKENKSVKMDDPFTRRKCTPSIVHNRNSTNNNNSGDTNGAHDKNGLDLANKASNSSLISGAEKAAAAESVKSVDDLFQAHSSITLELDIDI